MGTTLQFAMAFHPKKDGQMEVTNQTLGNILWCLVQGNTSSWDELHPRAEFAYNASEHHATRYSPFRVNTGRDPNLPVDLLPLPTTGANSTEAITFATDLAALHWQVHDRLTTYNNKIKPAADKHRHLREFQVGDMVMVRLRPERYANENEHNLHPRAAGPFQVCEKINPNAYDIAIPPDWRIPSTFYICDLVTYQGRLEVPTEPGRPPDSTESSLLDPEEDDGSRSPRKGVTTDVPMVIPIGTNIDDDGTEERTERPRRSAKLTRATEYVYF